MVWSSMNQIKRKFSAVMPQEFLGSEEYELQ
jgi:hypothetical protein